MLVFILQFLPPHPSVSNQLTSEVRGEKRGRRVERADSKYLIQIMISIALKIGKMRYERIEGPSSNFQTDVYDLTKY